MAETGKHTIVVSDKLYKGIKEYCTLNGLKINAFVDELLTRAFNIEKFGTAPFQTMPVVIPVVEEDKKAEDLFSEIVKNVGGDEAYSSMISDLLFEPTAEDVKQKTEEVLNDVQSRHDVAETVAKQENVEKNDDSRDIIETIAPKVPQETAKVADNVPQSTSTQKPHKKVTRLN